VTGLHIFPEDAVQLSHGIVRIVLSAPQSFARLQTLLLGALQRKPPPVDFELIDATPISLDALEFDRDAASDQQGAHDPEGFGVNVIRDRIGNDSLASRVGVKIDRVVKFWVL
jgi:hypothetical protein